MFLRRSVAPLLTALLLAASTQVRPVAWAQGAAYSFRAPSRDGIGKVYMGREIARVMGHAVDSPCRITCGLPAHRIAYDHTLNRRPTA